MDEFFREQQKKLTETLDKFYTINAPYDYPIDSEEQINIEQELRKLAELEKFYSVIEKGQSQGSIFEEYSNHLQEVRMAIEVIEREKQAIEQEHSDDIANIRMLLANIASRLDE
ncbi:hypothetical protein QWY14_14370 [Planococcus sp. N028]|uniref:Uncharacterized protein n=1 Tax=Planococcus shixiaomingii TaxID=3058393 RepID=A0ABT8N526_9BACL|nr:MULTISPECIES: hypothetical protein [unclassified Planococcus (in: firmicutes)]MDN7242997.1 hypothetical protein [Planococcus sp. N028]WKA55379.1 hypothetical protein QWY21_03085 [Planococcus sp. N022]